MLPNVCFSVCATSSDNLKYILQNEFLGQPGVIIVFFFDFAQGFIKFRKRSRYVRYHSSEIAQSDRRLTFLNAQSDFFFMRPSTINRPMRAGIEVLYVDNLAAFIIRTESCF